MTHQDDIKFVDGAYVAVTSAQLEGWQFRAASGNTYEAWGNCPVCGGAAFGPKLPVLPDFTTKKLVEDEVDVPCECHCGEDHGGGADKGCGRWWIATGTVSARGE